MNVILSHRQLDFDALASMLAASKLHPDYELVLDGKSNAYVQEFLALSKDSLPFKDLHNVELDQIDKVILVDTHELQRAGVLGSKLANKPGIELLIYDHHPYSGVKMPNVIIEPVGACTSILVEKIMDLGIPLSSFEATLLALGIYDDTGSLIFETTTAKDVKAVAFLIEQGANLGVVATYLRKSLTQEQKDLLYELLDNGSTEVFSGSPVYIAYAQCPDYIGGLALLAHRIGELEGADTLFLVVKMENRVYVVGRSKNRGLPVNVIIKAFGGAGHENAASASIKGIEVPEVLTKLRDEINLRIRNPYLVKDIMSYPVRHVSPDTKLQEVEHLLLKYGHTGVPVVEAGRLVGVISRRDVQKAVQHGLEHAPVKGFMTKEVIVVPPDASWEEVQRLMVEYDIGRIPVVLDHQLVGIVSRSDILRLVHGGAVAIEADLAHERSKVLRQDIQDLLANLPDYVGNLIQNASLVADELNYSVYIVGGFVRDLLLGNPTKDIDFVVEGNSSIFASTLASRLTDLELTVHSQFGTATLNFPDGTHVDVARTRWEHYQFPGALPQVEESTIKEDLFRRDFTINAMAICINLDRYGQLVDYYGGLRDLRQAEIRVLHNLSFIDDPTRILRAVRFAQRYGFHLAKETEEKIQTALAGGVLKKISSERFTQELFLILAEDKYTHMLEQLRGLGVLKQWFNNDYNWELRKVELTQGSKQEDLIVRRWLTLIWQLEDVQIEEILSNLKLTKSLKYFSKKYCELRSKLLDSSRNLVEMDTILKEIPKVLVEVLLLNPSLEIPLKAYCQALSKIQMQADGLLLRKLGVKEGPILGRMLNEIRNAWLDGRITTAEEEKRFVERIITEMDIKEEKSCPDSIYQR